MFVNMMHSILKFAYNDNFLKIILQIISQIRKIINNNELICTASTKK